MSYIDNNLLPNEQVVYRSHLHWIIFSRAALWFAVAIFFHYINFYVSPILAPYYRFVILVPIAIGVIDILTSLIKYSTTEFGVTNKRVIMKMGFIRRYSSENFLQKIENIQVEQSIGGRIFNYGTVIIIGTGGTREAFYLVDDPLEFRKHVQIQVESVIDKDQDK